MKWDQTLSVGVASLDEQHQRLIEINNRVEILFKEAFKEGGNYGEALSVLEELNHYAKVHFKEEEAYMASIGFPLTQNHVLDHQNFVRYLDAVQISRLETSPEEVLLELFAFLSEWIIDHIRDKDFKYKEYLASSLEQI